MPKPKRTDKAKWKTAKAKMNWKPWLRNVTEPKALSHETMHDITVNSRWAFSLMQRTKAELIMVHTEILDPDAVDQLMANLLETQRWLEATAHMVSCAHDRLLASAEVADAKGLKFKGVVDLNGPVPEKPLGERWGAPADQLEA